MFIDAGDIDANINVTANYPSTLAVLILYSSFM